jgi:hypothetical protein
MQSLKIRAIAIGTGVGAVFALASSLYYSPYSAITTMKQAAADKDATALAERIDFLSLQKSIKDRIKFQALKNIGDAAGGVSQLEANTLDRIIDPMVDKIVSPTGLDLLMQERLPEAKFTLAQVEQNIDPSRIKMFYQSFDRFVVKVADKQSPDKNVHLIFKRDWFDWKLAEIDLSQV